MKLRVGVLLLIAGFLIGCGDSGPPPQPAHTPPATGEPLRDKDGKPVGPDGKPIPESKETNKETKK